MFKIIKTVFSALCVFGLASTVVFAQGGTYNNCRFGVTVQSDFTPFQSEAVQNLNIGWYVNWRTSPSSAEPVGVEHVNIVRLQPNLTSYTSVPDVAEIVSIATNNPGQTWFIGNEPDSIFQDKLWATIYADAYYDLYHAIKSADPTAKVGIGAVVQPTPLRFQYLDIIWDTYRDKYGTVMPVDIWNIHSFILREERGTWGAFIPPGPEFSDIDTGILYDARDMDNINIFRQRLYDFRQWMADHGQRDKPLYITEYGVLWPEDYMDEDGNLFDQTRVSNFMQLSFDVMRNTKDTTLGYPYDDNRLVQRWAWYSLDGYPITGYDAMGGSMFNAATGDIRLLGEGYQNYTQSISPTAVLSLVKTKTQLISSTGSGSLMLSSFLLTGEVANAGNITSSYPITVTFIMGTPENPQAQIGGAQVITQPIAGCGKEYVSVSTSWNNIPPGANPYFVQMVYDTGTTGLYTRTVTGIALVPTHYVYLPVVLKFL